MILIFQSYLYFFFQLQDEKRFSSLWISDESCIHFSRCLFKNNEGPAGAAIYVNSINAIIEFCSFINNYATHISDVYFTSSDFLKIANCKFGKKLCKWFEY